ncbi:hypothetical protein N7492_003784 [Penicillium capsulatum]|uniref:Uncharacterized protein n=1 Tax=Penicillium capsulatum TaxID=69766 RepID=A0A9W9IMH9_9EURO|nr:hypothetical protein N7492_003784 [Penicillium capsulatum]KAJ6121633.1 hypothetical protein N7512_004098 [Penicillium capsulatum]
MPSSQRPSNFYISVPPPSQGTVNDYRPFGRDVDSTIDRILSEEASRASAGESEPPADARDQAIGKSRFFKSAPSSKLKNKKQHVATRTITVVDIASDGETSEGDLDVNDHREIQLEGQEGSAPSSASPQNIDDPGDSRSGAMESANDASTGPIVQNILSDSDAADVAEEDFIFASMDEGKRANLCEFIASHPFMSAAVPPVKRTDRAQFLSEICNEALYRGMQLQRLGRFVAYVRKMYLEHVGMQMEPPKKPDMDFPWGQEIEEDTSGSRRRKHRSCSLNSSELNQAKKPKTTNIQSSRDSINSVPRQNGGESTGRHFPNALGPTPTDSPRPTNAQDAFDSDGTEFQDTHEFLNGDEETNGKPLVTEDCREPDIATSSAIYRKYSRIPPKPGPLSPPMNRQAKPGRFGSDAPPTACLTHATDSPSYGLRTNKTNNNHKRQVHKESQNPALGDDLASSPKPAHAASLISTPRRKTSSHSPSAKSHRSSGRASTADKFSTPSKSPSSKYPPLSPDPAEWDLDF